MPQDVLFSVILPTYNRSKQLSRALDSVLSQTFTEYEILVIDDGSTDETPKVLQQYHDRVDCIRQRNAGISAARNAGIRQARGAYLAFLDDDDRWYPHKLEVMAAAIRQHPTAGLFHSQVDYVDRKGNWLWTTNAPRRNAYLTLVQGNFVAMLSAVVRKNCLDRVGVFDPCLPVCVDWDLFLRVTRYFETVYVAQTLAEYRFLSDDSITVRYQKLPAYQNLVLEKAIAADPALSPAVKKRARAAQAFRNGTSLFQAGDTEGALIEFKASLRIHPLYWRAAVYFLLMRLPGVRHKVPSALKRRLRLHENL